MTSTTPNDALSILGMTIVSCIAIPLIISIIGFRPGGVARGSVASSFQSSVTKITPGSLFALLQSMGTAPAATGIMTGVIVGFTSLTIFSMIRGPESVLHSFMHLTSSLTSTIDTVTQKIPTVAQGVYDVIKPIALVIFDALRVITPIIFGFFFVIFGVIRDSLLTLTAVVKAIVKQVEERRAAGN
ncbi:hypothetical protein CPB86DRAFT_784679 [Serendipita vermifera]|nr:hypothetical protein CPB86DRAFT_784679 [Serendipita vermifera]